MPCAHSVVGEEGYQIDARTGHEVSLAYRLCILPLPDLPPWLDKWKGASILAADTCQACKFYEPKLSETQRTK
jgi:hypothetical protein